MNHEIESHLHDLRKPFLVMGVGVPGAHKSHLLKPFAEKIGALYVNPTDLLKNHKKVNAQGEVVQDEWDTMPDQERKKDVWNTIQGVAGEYFELGGSMVFDATNRYAEMRKQNVETFRELGARSFVAAYFAVDLSVVHRRLIQYKGTVKRRYATHVHQMITAHPPCLEEGFDKIITLDANNSENENDPKFPIIGVDDGENWI
jgi:predicted kinase